MKIETILNAMAKTRDDKSSYHLPSLWKWTRRGRQYYAFRDRIIRMDEEKDKLIKEIDGELELWQRGLLG
jgi:hypothetical protein